VLGAGTQVRQYQIIRELGRGGMGCVYLARDTRLGRRVAMKFLTTQPPELAGRFLAEARATARCNHENIVVIHEVDTYEGLAYMVLEYLEGTTLAKVMAERAMSAGHSAQLLVPVVRALVRAHEDGIVHRDLKPENIFVTANGTIKVLDFGIAKIFETERDEASPAASPPEHDIGLHSLPAGTLPYMAPEQILMDVDPRTDIWAVGVILHEMLLGGHPLRALHPEAMVRWLVDLDRPMPPLDCADVPGAMKALVERCLAKRRCDRYPSARALLVELEALLPLRAARPLGEDESPFPGLDAFQERDAERFFGRTSEVAHMVALLGRHPIAGLVGPSGVGKSSFVLAGLVPALKAAGDPWEALTLRPGRRPLASLARLLADAEPQAFRDTTPLPGMTSRTPGRSAAVDEAALLERMRAEPGYLGARLRERAARKGHRILIFVDQLEEIHTLGAAADERAAFVASLAALADDDASPLRLVVAVRSDFLDRIAEDRRFADELTRGLMFLRPLDHAGLREAILRPLDLVGYRFESSEIVAEMLAALEGVAGALPLLQFAAAKLWDGRDVARKVLTRRTYAAMGGVSGALATHADAVLQALPTAQQRLARQVAVRLVTSERTRAIVDLRELRALSRSPGEVDSLVEHLAAARLVVVQTRDEVEGPTVELVHDSLVDSWPGLRRWLDESKEETAFLLELRAAARQWDARGRKPGMLWRGEAMEEARLWRARVRGDLGPRESEFLRAVFALADRSARIRNGVIAGTIIVLVGLVAAGGVALVSIRRAQTQAVEAATQARHEAERALVAEARIKEQLAVIQSEQKARQESDALVQQGQQELRSVNHELELALGKARAESQRAREAATTAQELAVSLRRANEELQRLLAQERIRSESLAKERKKITTELK
jgi:serine/threonine protein kinase